VGLGLGQQHAISFIVHWPKGIAAKGEIRTQYAHLKQAEMRSVMAHQ
jgi:hypothetical protein